MGQRDAHKETSLPLTETLRKRNNHKISDEIGEMNKV